MVFQEKNLFDLDELFCEEELDFEKNELDLQDFAKNDEKCVENELGIAKNDEKVKKCDDELNYLFSKEKMSVYDNIDMKNNEEIMNLMLERKSAVKWIMSVVEHYGFSVMTGVLSVDYYDRFMCSVCFEKEKQPWMSQLVALACLSLAAKMEEIHVPLLLDLQVEEIKYVFEPKTIMKMELLVLSTLEWKMNPVTPLSFIDYTVRRLGMKTHLQSRFLGRCERILHAAMIDPKFGTYLPSVLAAGTMLHVLKEIEPDNVLDCQLELLNVLGLTRDKVDDCYEFILDSLASYGNEQSQTYNRKYLSTPNSPNGVIDAYLSCDSSNDSWTAAPLVASSPEPPFKRSRSCDQQMRVGPWRHF